MATPEDRRDPFPAFRFEVVISELRGIGGFSECSGLQLETQVEQYREGGWNHQLRQFPTRTTHSNLTLKRGIVDRVLWDWYFDLTRGVMRRLGGSIIVRDEAGQPVMTWHVKDAFPCKWIGPELNASQSSVAVETLELCHEGYERLV